MTEQTVLNIYVDGSSKPHPRRGGVGIRFKYTDMHGQDISQNVQWPGYLGANSQEMEINACIIALREAAAILVKQEFKKIMIFSDSNYVVDNYKNAIFRWPKTRWLRVGGAPVLNAELWKDLSKLIKDCGLFVEINKVKGHSNDLDNRIADKLAKESAEHASQAPIAIRIVRRKKSKEKTIIGSVVPQGQKITIRIIEGQLLKPQNIYRYRYEVMSKNSPFYQRLDFVCADVPLHETSTYYVKLNNEKDNPRIVKVYRERITKTE